MTKKDIFGIRYLDKDSGTAIIAFLKSYHVLDVGFVGDPETGRGMIRFDQSSDKGLIGYDVELDNYVVLNKLTGKFFVLSYDEYFALKTVLTNES